VVVVGNVPTGFDREPHFYNKELTVKMSCSYGPGRYDPEYEDKGHDYPVGYVRWTENRNMKAFQELISQGKIDISYLTTHIFKPEDAPAAYDMILKSQSLILAYLLSMIQIKNRKIKGNCTFQAFSLQHSAFSRNHRVYRGGIIRSELFTPSHSKRPKCGFKRCNDLYFSQFPFRGRSIWF